MRDTTHEMTVKMREMILENNPAISKAEFRREFFLKFYGNDFCDRDIKKILSYLEGG